MQGLAAAAAEPLAARAEEQALETAFAVAADKHGQRVHFAAKVLELGGDIAQPAFRNDLQVGIGLQ